MSTLDEDTIKYFQEASPEEKLQILRHEMLTPIGTVRAVEKLLRKTDLKAMEGSPEEIDSLLDSLAKAGNYLKEVLEIVTGEDNG